MERVSQKLLVLRHLAQGNTLTTLEAVDRFGCMALSQRCTDLRRDGWPIESRMIETPTGKRIAEYFYDTSKQEAVF